MEFEQNCNVEIQNGLYLPKQRRSEWATEEDKYIHTHYSNRPCNDILREIGIPETLLEEKYKPRNITCQDMYNISLKDINGQDDQVYAKIFKNRSEEIIDLYNIQQILENCKYEYREIEKLLINGSANLAPLSYEPEMLKKVRQRLASRMDGKRSMKKDKK